MKRGRGRGRGGLPESNTVAGMCNMKFNMYNCHACVEYQLPLAMWYTIPYHMARGKLILNTI